MSQCTDSAQISNTHEYSVVWHGKGIQNKVKNTMMIAYKVFSSSQMKSNMWTLLGYLTDGKISSSTSINGNNGYLQTTVLNSMSLPVTTQTRPYAQTQAGTFRAMSWSCCPTINHGYESNLPATLTFDLCTQTQLNFWWICDSHTFSCHWAVTQNILMRKSFLFYFWTRCK